MGLFNKTDEEKKQLGIISTINYSNLENDCKNFITTYVNKVIGNAYPNDFDDLDTLWRIVDKLVAGTYNDLDDFKYHFEEVKRYYHIFVDKSSKTYEKDKDRFIDDMVGSEGSIYRCAIDDELLADFPNKSEYFDIADLINSDNLLIENKKYIIEYASALSGYPINLERKRRFIIGFIVGLGNVIDKNYEKYTSDKIKDFKKSMGIYDNVDPKVFVSLDRKASEAKQVGETLLVAVQGAEKAKTELLETIDDGITQLNAQTQKCLELIRQEKNLSILQLKKVEREQSDALIKKIDDILATRSDTAFKGFLDIYKQQVEDFRKVLQDYSSEAATILANLQTEYNKCVEQLRNFAKSDPELRNLISSVSEHNATREEIIEVVKSTLEINKVLDGSTEKIDKKQVYIPGYGRHNVPYKEIVLPSEINKKPINYFDESIPIDKRIDLAKSAMDDARKRGVLFHKKTESIIIDLIEGDFPYLWGDSGTGKSFIMKQVAELLGLVYYKAGKISEKHSVLGYHDVNGNYRFTPTFIATLYGGLLGLDELDNGNPDNIVLLNDLYSELSHKLYYPTSVCEVMFGENISVEINPNFRMISAGNTNGEGENLIYNSRGKIDESVHERWTPIKIDYDTDLEKKMMGGLNEWYDFLINFRSICTSYAKNSDSNNTPVGSISTRDFERIKRYLDHNSKDVDQLVLEMLIQTKDDEYCKKLAHELASIYSFRENEIVNPEFNEASRKASGLVLAKKFNYYAQTGVR